MMATNVVLDEIRKIVTVSYPVCLKRLHDLLIDSGHDDQIRATIREWTEEHPGQTRLLARSIVEGLSLWPYTLDILRRLSRVDSLREAVLLEHPSLLSQLLDRSSRSSNEHDTLTGLLVELLSKPLPLAIPLPAATQSLLWRLFENAVQIPSPASVEPVYLLLGGACEGLLDILPQASLEKLRHHLTKLMRGVKTHDEEIQTLYCLAIIAKMNDHRKGLKAADRSSLMGPPAHPKDENTKFFSGDRSARTIQLLALQTIQGCRQGERQRIRLARQILQAIEPPARMGWARTKENAVVMDKLWQHGCRSDIAPIIQLDGLAVASMFVESSSIPDSAVEVFQRSILSPELNQSRDLQAAFDVALPMFLPRLHQAFWVRFFESGLEPTIKTRTEQRYWLALLRHSRALIPQHPHVRGSISQAISSHEVSTSLAGCLEGDPLKLSEPHLSLFALVLELATMPGNGASTINQSICLRLISALEQRRAQPIRKPDVNSYMPQTPAPLSIMEQESTPDNGEVSRYWRQQLMAELGIDARQRHESIVHLVAKVCYNLEKRCEDVETPLRVEQARVSDLECQLAESQRAYNDMEARWLARGEDLEEARRSVKQTQVQLQDASAETEDLTTRLTELQDDLEKANINAARLLESTKASLEEQILQLQATVACQTERIDGMNDEASNLKQQLQAKEEEVLNQDKQHQDYRASLEAKAQELRQSGEIKDLEIERGQQEVQELRNKVSISATKLQDLEQQAHEASTRFNETIINHDRTMQASRQEMTDLQAQHELEITTLNSNASNEHQATVQRHEESIRNLEMARHQVELDLGDQTARARRLHDQLQECRSNLEERSAQLEQAEKWKLKLMAVMEPDTGAVAVRKSKHGTASSSAKTVSRRRSRQEHQQTDMSSAIYGQGHEVRSSYGSDAFTTQSPSPKRVKAQPAMRTPATKHATFAAGTKSCKLARNRRSLGLPALGESSSSRLNGLLTDRRKSGASSVLTSDEKSDENMSEGFTPVGPSSSPISTAKGSGWHSARRKSVSSEAAMFDNLRSEEFDDTTVDV